MCCKSVMPVSEMIDGLDKPSSIENSIQALMSSQNCDKPFYEGNSYQITFNISVLLIFLSFKLMEYIYWKGRGKGQWESLFFFNPLS